MEYGIETKEGKPIAKFVHEVDRNICLDALAEYWEDCEFVATSEAT